MFNDILADRVQLAALLVRAARKAKVVHPKLHEKWIEISVDGQRDAANTEIGRAYAAAITTIALDMAQDLN